MTNTKVAEIEISAPISAEITIITDATGYQIKLADETVVLQDDISGGYFTADLSSLSSGVAYYIYLSKSSNINTVNFDSTIDTTIKGVYLDGSTFTSLTLGVGSTYDIDDADNIKLYECLTLTTISVGAIGGAVASTALSGLWSAWGWNPPINGTLVMPSSSTTDEADNISEVLDEFYGWTVSGNVTDTWTWITTPAELEAIGTDASTLAGNYKLANDIDFAGRGTGELGFYTSAIIAGIFTGKLNLNTHAIKNFIAKTSSDVSLALFFAGSGCEIYGGTIHGDIEIDCVAYDNAYSAIIVAAPSTDVHIHDIRVEGSVSSPKRIAGVCGFCGNNSYINNCLIDVDVTGVGATPDRVSGVISNGYGADSHCVVMNCLHTGRLTNVNSTAFGTYSGTAINYFWTDQNYAGYITAAETADPATFAYSGTPDAWAEATAYVVGDIVGDGTYAYIATEPSTGVHPSTLIGWSRLGFDFTGQRNPYDYGLVGVEQAGEVWYGTSTKIPQANGSYFDTELGEYVVNGSGDNWVVVDLREIWKMSGGVPRLDWERVTGAYSRMARSLFGRRFSRIGGGSRIG